MISWARIVSVKYSGAYLWTFGNFASVIVSSNLEYEQHMKRLMMMNGFNRLVKWSGLMTPENNEIRDIIHDTVGM